MTQALAQARKRLHESLESFDAEVAYQLSIEGERADMWDDIDVNVEDLRVILTAIDAALEGAPAPVEGVEPVVWRWRPKGSNTWFYDPRLAWLNTQSLDDIDKEQVFPASAISRLVKEMDEAMDTVNNLIGELARSGIALVDENNKRMEAEASVARLTALLAEADEVVKPFAEVAGEWDGETDYLHVFLEWNDSGDPVPSLPVADFRAARRYQQKREAK